MREGQLYQDRNGENFRPYRTRTGWRLVYRNRTVFV
jgi:hypothetical protein